MVKLFRFYVCFYSLLIFNRTYLLANNIISLFLVLSSSLILFSLFFSFLRLSYLLWLDTLIIDFLQKKSFHNFIKSYVLISPDFIENSIFKFISNPLTLRIVSMYRHFMLKESSSTYSFLSLMYFTVTIFLSFVLLTYLSYSTLFF